MSNQLDLVPVFLGLIDFFFFVHIVWSMPGGFTSGGREGYQTVDDAEEPFIRNARPTPPHRMAPPKTAELPTAPGAYQSVV